MQNTNYTSDSFELTTEEVKELKGQAKAEYNLLTELGF